MSLNQSATAVKAVRKGEVMTWAALARGEDVVVKKDMTARDTAMTATAKSTHNPFRLRKSFKGMSPFVC